jgi:hypothetical protein
MNPRPGDDPISQTTQSIELDIQDGVDFHTRLRTMGEMATIRGQLTKTEEEHRLQISIQFLADVEHSDALTGAEAKISCQTQIAIVPGQAMVVAGSIRGKTRDVFCIHVDKRPTNKEMDADRRRVLKSQYAELLRHALHSDDLVLPKLMKSKSANRSASDSRAECPSPGCDHPFNPTRDFDMN